MTSIGLRPVLLPGGNLSDAKRAEGLRWLALSIEEHLPLDVAHWLAGWSHPSLSPERQGQLLALLTDSLERAEVLADGSADHATEDPELTCDERQDTARWDMENRANEALFALLHGEQR